MASQVVSFYDRGVKIEAVLILDSGAMSNRSRVELYLQIPR